MKTLFFIEVTDTYGGAPSYSWSTRHVIRAGTMRGAVNKFSRLSGMNWHKECGDSECARYDSKSGATCYYIRHYDGLDDYYSFNTDER